MSVVRFSCVSLGALACLTACYEIPPEFEADGGETEWSRAAVYAPDVFDPRNRWFQRAFLEIPGATLPEGWRSSGSAEPFPPAAPFSTVDCAEMVALLEEIDTTWQPSTDRRASVANAVLHSDLLAMAVGWRDRTAGSTDSRWTRLQTEAREATWRTAERSRLPGSPEDLEPVPAPPVRAANWDEVSTPLPPGLLPSRSDLRWTRVLRGRGSQERTRVLLRLRVGQGPGDEVTLLPIASEAWVLADDRAEVWRWDRERWMQGLEPWRQLTADEVFSIRDPHTDVEGWRTGTPESLCGECHSPGAAEFTGPRLSASVDDQRTMLEALLRKPGS